MLGSIKMTSYQGKNTLITRINPTVCTVVALSAQLLLRRLKNEVREAAHFEYRTMGAATNKGTLSMSICSQSLNRSTTAWPLSCCKSLLTSPTNSSYRRPLIDFILEQTVLYDSSAIKTSELRMQ